MSLSLLDLPLPVRVRGIGATIHKIRAFRLLFEVRAKVSLSHHVRGIQKGYDVCLCLPGLLVTGKLVSVISSSKFLGMS